MYNFHNFKADLGFFKVVLLQAEYCNRLKSSTNFYLNSVDANLGVCF